MHWKLSILDITIFGTNQSWNMTKEPHTMVKQFKHGRNCGDMYEQQESNTFFVFVFSNDLRL